VASFWTALAAVSAIGLHGKGMQEYNDNKSEDAYQEISPEAMAGKDTMTIKVRMLINRYHLKLCQARIQ
jgi:hypothetical protein